MRSLKSYIAADSPQNAKRFLRKIIEKVDRIAAMPELGSIVPELDREDVRE